MYNIFKLTVILSVLTLTGCGGSSGSLDVKECELQNFANAQDNSALKITWGEPVYTGLGTYPRIKEVKKNIGSDETQLLLIFSDGPDIRYRISDDKGVTWSNDHIVAHPTNPDGAPQYNYTNGELIELANGDWIISYNARPMGNNKNDQKEVQQPGVNFDIRVKISKDKGLTWSSEEIVVTGGDHLKAGIWEPIFLQLANGHVQMYYADESLYGDGQQQISMLTSTDSGASWSQTAKKVSFRAGYRDGMPVPIISKRNELIMAIEDNGVDGGAGGFKPTIIRTTSVDPWSQGFVDGNSANRNRALNINDSIAVYDTSGGPYIDQLPSGEILLSVYSSQCRNDRGSLNNALARVYIGDDRAEEFSYASTPFSADFLTIDGQALWSSVTVLDDTTVLAAAAVRSAGSRPNGAYVVKGTITRSN